MEEFAKSISCEVLVKHIEIRESAHTVGSADLQLSALRRYFIAYKNCQELIEISHRNDHDSRASFASHKLHSSKNKIAVR